MNTRISSNSKKPPHNGTKPDKLGRKLALLQDVENLKKKLRHEENVHRALQRAFHRPLGALPRLPPYLPQYTLELVAEVAVLEEEVVRLEEKVVNFRQEAAHISSSTTPCHEHDSASKHKHSRASSQSEFDSGSSLSRIASSRKFMSLESSSKPPQNDRALAFDTERNSTSKSLPVKKHCSTEGGGDVESEANRTSQDVLNCLISIFVRMSSSRRKTMDLSSLACSKESTFRDPYFNSNELKKRDVGAYKHLYEIEARQVDQKYRANAAFLIRRLRILLDKLASLKLDGLSHHQKLAFWINIYNSCVMNEGIPESPETTVATIRVGGFVLNALTIEHLILRLPYHLNYTCTKSTRNDEKDICRTLGLEWSEPLVTFALSSGSWSCPALRVYTASQIESELEAAKKAYLQAAVGISAASNKLVVPKLLEWYLLDFAKEMDALLDWICLQLPDELRNEAVQCLGSKDKGPVSELVEVKPYNFSFRYLVHR
ncbi:hypothetical protein SASPL_143479 [Salvia splendens]|uniref:Ternary complex factor MIP1 leucine-zipper domain-containing protein n=1 Tax=Salvia splendens TaxID=180675 RepID=A0A8X8WLP6_SALSN|nr:hypothetical protein SASPL_143479 [Salvia splendens]